MISPEPAVGLTPPPQQDLSPSLSQQDLAPPSSPSLQPPSTSSGSSTLLSPPSPRPSGTFPQPDFTQQSSPRPDHVQAQGSSPILHHAATMPQQHVAKQSTQVHHAPSMPASAQVPLSCIVIRVCLFFSSMTPARSLSSAINMDRAGGITSFSRRAAFVLVAIFQQE